MLQKMSNIHILQPMELIPTFREIFCIKQILRLARQNSLRAETRKKTLKNGGNPLPSNFEVKNVEICTEIATPYGSWGSV